MRRLREYRSKTAQTYSSPALQFFTRKITQRRSANCGANSKDCDRFAFKIRALARYHRLGFFSGFGHHLVGLRDPNDFFDGCFAFSDASPTVLPQSLHAFCDGALLQLAAVAFSHDHLSQRFRDEANLINCRAPLIPSLTALIATGAALETGTVFFHGKTDFREIFARIIDQLRAL